MRQHKLVDFVRGKDTCLCVTDTCSSCMIERERERKKESDVILLKAKQGLAPIYFLPSGEVSVCGSREDREKKQQGLFLEFHFCGNFV